MHTHSDLTADNKNNVDQGGTHQQQKHAGAEKEITDKRPASIAQRKLQESILNSPRLKQFRSQQDLIQSKAKKDTPLQQEEKQQNTEEGPIQRQSKTAEGYEKQVAPNPIQKKSKADGLPEQLQSGIETLSGQSMDDVKVHYNSDKPAQLQAHAFAQGSDIHLGPGQERHLPHEAWHVVQQKQGRVKVTTQLKGEKINDDAKLEQEADEMGDKATKVLQKKEPPANPEKEKKPESPIAVFQQQPVQRAAAYNGPAITPAAGAWSKQNILIIDKINYGGVTAQNTAKWAHAETIDGDWIGWGVNDHPTNWEKFTRLVGPYAVKHLVQGHMLNERIGGEGEARNLAPLTASANTRHWNSVESPIKQWLDADTKNAVDYKITPQYTGAKNTLKTKLINEFKATRAEATSGTQPNLRTWLGNYIDNTIPAYLDIQVYFMQANGAWPYGNKRARRKPLINARIHNKEVATFGGARVSGYRGNYSNFVYHINDVIQYGPANAQNTGTVGHANRIDNFHNGSAVNSHPNNWDKFTRLVGPYAVSNFVQGHLINQKVGGQGINKNLTPLTSSANAMHNTKVESPIKNWLKKSAANNLGPYLIDYMVTPNYGGANPALKNTLLNEFDDNNDELTGDTQVNLTNWLNNYIDATFPEQIDVDVQFMKSSEPYVGKSPAARLKEKPALNGNVTNEPA